MQRLDEFDPPTVAQTGRQWIARLEDVPGAAFVALAHDTPMTAYRLDQTAPWQPGEKRCDALLVVEDPAVVVFVEHKGGIDADGHDKAVAQITAAIEHFAHANPHGGVHHGQWAQGDDLPMYPQGRHTRALQGDRAHRVVGAVVGRSGGARTWPVPTVTVGTKTATIYTVPPRWRRNDPPRPLREFLGDLQVR